jgi:hypothetical protein
MIVLTSHSENYLLIPLMAAMMTILGVLLLLAVHWCLVECPLL